jgi:hypothetical protein
MLSMLPPMLRRQLHEAALSLDTDETNAIIAKIQPLVPGLAEALQELVKIYQFGQIIHLTKITTDFR